jgi:hypothetical protein
VNEEYVNKEHVKEEHVNEELLEIILSVFSIV